jgi:hypothetical protein
VEFASSIKPRPVLVGSALRPSTFWGSSWSASTRAAKKTVPRSPVATHVVSRFNLLITSCVPGNAECIWACKEGAGIALDFPSPATSSHVFRSMPQRIRRSACNHEFANLGIGLFPESVNSKPFVWTELFLAAVFFADNIPDPNLSRKKTPKSLQVWAICDNSSNYNNYETTRLLASSVILPRDRGRNNLASWNFREFARPPNIWSNGGDENVKETEKHIPVIPESNSACDQLICWRFYNGVSAGGQR